MKKQLSIIMLSMISTFMLAQTVPTYVPASGLQSWYPFNGNANDESGNGIHCTVFNGAMSDSDRFGNTNASYLLDGVDDWIETDSFFLQTDNPHTISMWWKTTDSAKTNQTFFNTSPHTLETCVFHYSSITSTPPYSIFYGVGYGIGGSWDIMHPDNGQIVNTPPTLNNWHHLVWVKDSLLNWSFYFDGVEIDSFSSVSNTGNIIANLRFGAENNGFPTGGANFKGNLDDIGVWNRALSESEIQQLFYGPTANDNNVKCDWKYSIYPNPCNDLVFVRAEKNLNEQFYTLFNSLGQAVLKGKFTNEFPRISLNSLSPGIYFLSIHGTKQTVIKLIKN